MIIVKASLNDVNEIMSIFKDGQAFLKENNVDQWQDGYPTKEIVIDDIDKKQMFVVKDNNEIIGVFVLLIGKEPTYEYIEDGSWLSDTEYVTIHRICIKGNKRNSGIASFIVDEIKKTHNHIRIDTHKDNKVMRHFLKKNNFEYRGIIYLINGSPRVAYEYMEV